MQYKIAASKIHSLVISVKFIACIAFLSIITNILLGWFILFKTKTVLRLVPFCFSKPISVNGNEFNSEYIEMMGALFATQKLNFTPQTISGSQEFLLHYVDPDTYVSFRNELFKEKEKIIDSNLSGSFYIKRIDSNLHDLSVKITGTLKLNAGINATKEIQKTYGIYFSNKSGMLFIKNFVPLKNTHEEYKWKS